MACSMMKVWMGAHRGKREGTAGHPGLPVKALQKDGVYKKTGMVF